VGKVILLFIFYLFGRRVLHVMWEIFSIGVLRMLELHGKIQLPWWMLSDFRLYLEAGCLSCR
jgi:hypothetical protein